MIQRFFLFAFLIAAISACGQKHKSGGLSSDLVNDSLVPKMVFDTTRHYFGDIDQGDIVTYSFHFVNKGNGPLIISDYGSSCGCTVPEYPKEPIDPGKDGEITVKFDSHGKEGEVHKAVNIIANTKPNNNNLYIYANVKVK